MSLPKIRTEPIRLDFLGSKRSEDLPWERRSNHVLYKSKLGAEIEMAADPEEVVITQIHKWLQTEDGEWCVENATDLECHFHLDHSTLYYHIAVVGKLSPKHSTFHTLKFG